MALEGRSSANSPLISISGLPGNLPAGAVAALVDGGRSLVVASGRRLTIYRLEVDGDQARADQVQEIELPGRAFAVDESPLGVLIATQADRHAVVALLRERELSIIHRTAGTVTAFAVGGTHAYTVVREPEGDRARLLQLNIRQRAVSNSRALEHARMSVTIDRSGGHIVVTDIVARAVLSLDDRLQLIPLRLVAPPGHAPNRPGERARLKHPLGCCCFCCKPPADDGRPDDRSDDRHPSDGTPPSDGGPPGRDSPVPPHHHGDAGVPSNDGGTIVADRDRVDHHPPRGISPLPCGRSLFFGVVTLKHAGAYLLAADRNNRHVALLSADMNLVDEWDVGRGGAVLATTRESPMFLMHVRGSGQWSLHDADLIVSKYRPWLDLFPLLPLESKTFIGQQTYALSYGQPETPDHITALVLPVIEGNQTFSSANLSGFGAFVQRTAASAIKDYHDENSFGAMKNVSVTVFGAGKGPPGGPLKLPRAELAMYFFPEYKGAKLEIVKHGVNAASRVVFDGRESLKIEVKPLDGGSPASTLTLEFFALGFKLQQDLYPVTLKFIGNEKLTLQLTLPDGTAKTLQLAFTVKSIEFPDDASVTPTVAVPVPPKIAELIGYLDGIMQAAETAAGLTSRVFAPPKILRVREIAKQFGRLLVTFGAATTTGNKLAVTGATSTHPSGDPMGLDNPMLGSLSVTDSAALKEIVDNAALLAQDAAKVQFNVRVLNPSSAAFDAGASRLTTIITIANLHGGPGAMVKSLASSGTGEWFDTATSHANSASTNNNEKALRDRSELYQDAFSAAIDVLRTAKQPLDGLKEFSVILIMPLEAMDPAVTFPSEAWSVSALHRPFGFRGAENITTVIDRKDKTIQLPGAWALVFMPGGQPDTPLINHEIGHGLKFGDLYFQDGYRDELRYMGDWAMMDQHFRSPHHGGYHKLQAGWIPDGAGTSSDYGRVYPLDLPDASHVLVREMLMVPIELWRDSLAASSRTAFGVPGDFPVVQLVRIDFGGDGSVFGLIEARQRGVKFGQCLPDGAGGCLPPGVGGVLISNCISWARDDRFALADRYRRPVHLLNPNNILSTAGQQFDLAFAPEFAVKGLKVELLDVKIVEGDAQVFRIKVTRENAAFADVFMETGVPYYKSPDVWVDWTGDNGPGGKVPSLNEADHHKYPLGQPTDQGELLHVHPAGTNKSEQHWIVARIRNRGTVKAVDIDIQFFYYEPPGAGDGGKPMDVRNLDRYKFVGSKLEEIPGRDDPSYAPKDVLVPWPLHAGFAGHTCLYVHIKDSRVPEDSTGAVLGTADIWGQNNIAQKNVDVYEDKFGSPFEPVEFDFSVHNAGIRPELAYLEPDGLPYGMQLTVTPPFRTIASGKTAIFQCKLELDERIIRTGCENDRRFRIHAWREDPESSARWGGVEYEIRPREKTQAQLAGTWDEGHNIELKGTVSPAPGGGVVRIRLDFPQLQPTWIAVNCAPAGQFEWKGKAPSGNFSVRAVAVFEGNKKFASARSNDLELKAPPIIH